MGSEILLPKLEVCDYQQGIFLCVGDFLLFLREDFRQGKVFRKNSVCRRTCCMRMAARGMGWIVCGLLVQVTDEAESMQILCVYKYAERIYGN
jgi:hypothetical protein